MNGTVEELQRFGLKLFLRETARLEPNALIPVFHGWIQRGAVGDLLVDVADYSHLRDGPTIVLVGYEGNFALDDRGGRLGLSYNRKRPTPGTLADRLLAAGRTLLTAAQLIESDDTLGAPRFRGDTLELIVNDQLVAPPGAEAVDRLRPSLDELLGRLYPGHACTVETHSGDGDRLTLDVRSPVDLPLLDLLHRI